MAITYVEKEETYKINDMSAGITVSVVTGQGQGGAYLIFLGQNLKGTNAPAFLGTGSDCVGQTSIVSATIRDKLLQTNLTSVTVYISENGGAPTRFGPYEKEAAEHLDTVAYIISFKLIQ